MTMRQLHPRSDRALWQVAVMEVDGFIVPDSDGEADRHKGQFRLTSPEGRAMVQIVSRIQFEQLTARMIAERAND